MKKLFVCALAASMFTACSQDETISQQSPMQISFDCAFVENATRVANPSITTDNIEDFDVWGYMDNTNGMIFNREKVTKSGDVWSYANTQYWVPGKEYRFVAVAPAQSENIVIKSLYKDDILGNLWGLGVIEFTNVDGSEDFIYSRSELIKTDAEITAQPEDVKFTFNHMLSKVKFSFKNAFTNDNTTLKVSNVVMWAPQKGSIDTGSREFEPGNEKWQLINPSVTIPLNFSGEADTPAENGNGSKVIEIPATKTVACENERLTIPASKDIEYKVTFMVEMYQGDVLALSSKKEAVITGVELERGKAYNFIAELNASNISETGALYPITFAVEEVNEWTPATATEVLDNYTVEAGEELVLVADGTINGTLNVKGTLNGAGHTLTVAETPTNKFLVQPNGTAYIKNLTISGENKDVNGNRLYGIYINNPGEYTIADVAVKDVLYPLNVSLKSGKVTLNVINSTLEGWTSFAAVVDANFENVSFTKNTTTTYCNFKPHGNAILKNCTFAEGAYFDLSDLAADKKVHLINCNYNGTTITAENIATVFATFEGKDGKTGKEGYETVKNQILFQ